MDGSLEDDNDKQREAFRQLQRIFGEALVHIGEDGNYYFYHSVTSGKLQDIADFHNKIQDMAGQLSNVLGYDVTLNETSDIINFVIQFLPYKIGNDEAIEALKQIPDNCFAPINDELIRNKEEQELVHDTVEALNGWTAAPVASLTWHFANVNEEAGFLTDRPVANPEAAKFLIEDKLEIRGLKIEKGQIFMPLALVNHEIVDAIQARAQGESDLRQYLKPKLDETRLLGFRARTEERATRETGRLE